MPFENLPQKEDLWGNPSVRGVSKCRFDASVRRQKRQGECLIFLQVPQPRGSLAEAGVLVRNMQGASEDATGAATTPRKSQRTG